MDASYQRVIGFGLTFLLLALLNQWWARARLRTHPGEEHVLRYPKGMLLLGVTLASLAGGFAVLLTLHGAGVGTSASFFGVAAVLSLLVLESRVEHELFSGGMRYGRLFGNGGTLFWVDVTELRYSKAAKWFLVVLSDGRTARVSVMVTSLPAFATAALLHVPPSSVDPDTRSILADTAAGSPPSIWAS
jgi:hypothetical protein